MPIPNDANIHGFTHRNDTVYAAQSRRDNGIAQGLRIHAETGDCLKFFRNHGKKLVPVPKRVFIKESAMAATGDDIGRKPFQFHAVKQIAPAAGLHGTAVYLSTATASCSAYFFSAHSATASQKRSRAAASSCCQRMSCGEEQAF